MFGEGVKAVEGGESRSDSVSRALAEVDTDLVVVHDAARPLVEPGLIDAVVDALERGGEDCLGVVAATRVTDTIKEVYRGTEVSRTLDRSSLWAAQTPQAFRVRALREALSSASPLSQATDDAMLVERVRGTRGHVFVHEAPRENIKVTTPLDLRLAELLLAARS
jgi:2-C-methyl-D-erythritol 4-phosphate cytidylyltransferase